MKQRYLHWFCEVICEHEVGRTIHDYDISFVHLILYNKISDVDVPEVACTRVSLIYIHLHRTLIIFHFLIYLDIFYYA